MHEISYLTNQESTGTSRIQYPSKIIVVPDILGISGIDLSFET